MRIRNKPGRITANWRGADSKVAVLGYGNSPVPQVRQDDEGERGHAVRTKTVSADSQRTVRIPDVPCGFWIGRADFLWSVWIFRRVVLILNKPCGF